MSMNHHVPVPAPRPMCAIYKPQLALLVFDLLDADKATELRSHLADCEYCQLHLREYEIVRGALDRHVSPGPLASGDEAADATSRATRQPRLATAVPPHFTLEDIMQATNKPPTPTQTNDHPSTVHDLSPHRRAITALGAIAAVLVLTVLAASLFTYFGSRGVAPGAKPTPTRGLDAQSQAYLNVLETYYQPVYDAFVKVTGCRANSNPTTDPSRWMRSCQSYAPPMVATAQALKDHLTVTPPARWQTADAQIKQATDDTIAGFTAAAAATTDSEWSTAETHAELTACEYVAPITQINRELVPAGIPLSDLLGSMGVC